MKRLLTAGVVCVAALGLGAPIASADLVNQAVVRCQSTATWQVTIGATSYADLTNAAPAPGACKKLTAEVDDDLDFALQSDDLLTSAYDERFTLVGAFVTGLPAFAGTALGQDGTVRGPVEIANAETFNATITTVSSSGLTWVAEYTPAGSCGPNCYRTNYVLVGAWVN
jgi:hypothetical protein